MLQSIYVVVRYAFVKEIYIMRAIKKTIKTTVVDIFEPDMVTMTFEHIGGFEVAGGLGERLAVSRAKREYGKDVIVKCHDVEHVYKMDGETFLQYATICDGESEDDSENASED